MAGVGRALDDMGRIVIPAEIRAKLNMRGGDRLDITIEGDRIVLSPEHDRCEHCQYRLEGIQRRLREETNG